MAGAARGAPPACAPCAGRGSGAGPAPSPGSASPQQRSVLERRSAARTEAPPAPVRSRSSLRADRESSRPRPGSSPAPAAGGKPPPPLLAGLPESPPRSGAGGKSRRGHAAPLRRHLPVPPRAGGMMEPPAAAACASCRRRLLPPLLCLLIAALCLPSGERPPARGKRWPRPRRPGRAELGGGRPGRRWRCPPAASRSAPAPTAGSPLPGVAPHRCCPPHPAAPLEESGPLLPSEGAPAGAASPTGKAGAAPAVRGTERRWSYRSPWEAAVRSLRGVVSAAPAGATAPVRCRFHFQAERHVCAASRLQLGRLSRFSPPRLQCRPSPSRQLRDRQPPGPGSPGRRWARCPERQPRVGVPRSGSAACLRPLRPIGANFASPPLSVKALPSEALGK